MSIMEERPMDSENNLTSRRRLLRDLSAGVAIAAAAPTVLAQDGQSAAAGSQDGTPFLPNPLTEYPRPPFPPQQQPWPGLVSKMTPRPDHGEKTYKGSGRLWS